jgi:anti-sigma B factor antagonist
MGIYPCVNYESTMLATVVGRAVVDAVSRAHGRCGEARVVAEDLTVRSEVHGDAVVLRLVGDIDLMTAPIVNQSIKIALQQSPPVLIVDLSGVEFMASAGLAELATGHRLAGPGTAFQVVAPNRATSRPLEMVGLTTVFDVFPTLDDALENLARE